MSDRFLARARRRVYRAGLRPKPGQLLYSAALSKHYAIQDARKRYDRDIAAIKEEYDNG